jgi:hypothetical protein
MANLFRFILIAAITASTLVACNIWVNSEAPKTPLESKPLPSVPNIDPKNSDPERTPDAPYLQTPERVVIKMLEMAKVTSQDVVYDLGSGDGRIVIAAAQKFGAKAIGIEIDPELIRESERATKSASDKTPQIRSLIKFVKQDLFKTDLRDATVITLYLLPQANLRVRAEILPKLKSGTRIISYQYSLGDLPATRTEKVKVGDQEHMIYLWTID